MIEVSIEQAGAEIEHLVREVIRGGEVVLTDGNRPVARLVPVSPAEDRKPRKAGSARGQILYMADDFDAPLADFAEAL